MPNFLAKLVGIFIKNKLNLQETTMNDTKPWYQSKTIISAIIAAVIGVYNAIGSIKNLPPIPDWIFTILASIGIYGRVTADTKIG